MAQAKWEESKKSFEESVQVAGQINGKVFETQYRLAGAELALAMGDPHDAEGPVSQSLDLLRAAKAPDRELEARTLLARILLAEGKPAEARQEVARAETLARSSQHRSACLAFAVAAARVEAASGKPADTGRATRELQAAIAEAGRQGFAGYQLDGRLALAEIGAKAGKPAARTELEKLVKDARAAGFEAISQNAARTLGKA